MTDWEEFDEQLGEINKEFSRHRTEIRESFYSTKRAITAVLETALESAAKVVETVHPLYTTFEGLDATSRETMYKLVGAFEKLEGCVNEQIQLVETRKPELEKLEYGLIMPWLQGIEYRKAKLAMDRQKAGQDASALREEFGSYPARIDRLRDEINDLGREKNRVNKESTLGVLMPGLDIHPVAKELQAKIEEKEAEIRRLRVEAGEAAEKFRTAPADAYAALQQREEDLQIQTERSAAYIPGVKKMSETIDECAEELKKLRRYTILLLANDAREITGDAVGASRPPADKDALAVSLVDLALRSLTMFDKNVNGYLKNDGELVVSKLEKVYTVDGQLKLPDSVKGVFESLKTTLAGMQQEADEIGGYEEIPEWYTERREKLARGELKRF